jgi:hypothetical protein
MSPISTTRKLISLRSDVNGSVLSTELLLLVAVGVVGLIAGTTAVRDAVVSEMSDIGGFTQDLNQSFSVNGIQGHSGSSAGMDFVDAADFCDSAEDISGQADNCITFDVLPTNEDFVVSTDDLVANLDFDSGDASDSSPFGGSNNGSLEGDPEFVDGAVVFDGDDAINIRNSADINIGTHSQRTISLQFNADNVTTRQLLYEEGGTTRGLSIYIDNGLLYVGGWNVPDSESGWDPVFVSTSITAGTSNSVTLVLDGGTTVAPGALTGYANGRAFGTAAGSQLWSHGGGIGIGGTNGRTIFHDGRSSSNAYFSGSIDNFNIFNRALNAAEVQELTD